MRYTDNLNIVLKHIMTSLLESPRLIMAANVLFDIAHIACCGRNIYLTPTTIALWTSVIVNVLFCGSRGGTGGLPPPPLKNHKNMVSCHGFVYGL